MCNGDKKCAGCYREKLSFLRLPLSAARHRIVRHQVAWAKGITKMCCVYEEKSKEEKFNLNS